MLRMQAERLLKGRGPSFHTAPVLCWAGGARGSPQRLGATLGLLCPGSVGISALRGFSVQLEQWGFSAAERKFWEG